MKRFSLLVVALLGLLFSLSSCETEVSIQSAYSCGISEFNSSSLGDLSLIEKHIKDMGGPYGTIVIGPNKSEAANDAEIKALFDKAVSKMDFNSIGLNPKTTFTYSIQSAYSDEGKSKTIASYSWHKE